MKQTNTRIDPPTMKQARARLRHTGLTKTGEGTWTVSKKGPGALSVGGGVLGSASDRSVRNSSLGQCRCMYVPQYFQVCARVFKNT